MRTVHSILMVVLLSFGCAGGKSKDSVGVVDTAADTSSAPMPDLELGVTVPTIQIVNETVDPDRCESGWTMLRDSLAAQDARNAARPAVEDTNYAAYPPLQSAYVNTFDTIDEMFVATADSFALLDGVMPTVRVAVPWPCWMGSEDFRARFKAGIESLIAAGWKVELGLNHYDSFPPEQYVRYKDRPGLNPYKSGWAHEDVVEAYTAYVLSVTSELADAVPPGTVVYLSNEPASQLLNGFFDLVGSWPPGGSFLDGPDRNIAALKVAMRNMRDGFLAGNTIIQSRGLQSAIAINIRPGSHDDLLDYLFNWFFLDALVLGVVDDNLDSTPDYIDPVAPIDIVGITFYGTMTTGSLAADWDEEAGTRIAIPAFDLSEDPDSFRVAIVNTADRYPGAKIDIAEVGFSHHGDPAASLTAFVAYRDVVFDLRASGIEIVGFRLHVLLQAAEFSNGEWAFHLVDCSSGTCELTSWGAMLTAYLADGE